MSASGHRAGHDVARERVEAELAPALAALGLDLEAVELTTAGARRLLRVAVDKDGGVTDADLAEASRELSERLDASNPLGERPYTLEVTSRGVDRPLTEPRHWRRNRDRLVRVTGLGGEVVTGRIGTADDAGATLSVEGREQTVSYAEVSKAIVQIEFNRRAGEGS